MLTLQASQALQDVQDAQATATSELTVQIHTLMQQLQQANAELLTLQGEFADFTWIGEHICIA